MRIFPLSYHGFYPLIFLTSTAFVDTKAKYGISLSRYTAFLYNCPLGYDPNDTVRFVFNDDGDDGDGVRVKNVALCGILFHGRTRLRIQVL